jgi:glycine hydroxymethyltransferase
MRLDHGRHLTHGSPASIVSKFWRFISYGVTPESQDESHPGEVIDFDQVAHLAKTEKPALIVAGSTAYARIIDPQPFREIADSVGASFMYDAAHPAGLIAGGVHPSPVGIADVVTFTTHKTLRGPRGGAILCGDDLAKKIDSAVFPGLQGGPLEHVVAAKAVAFAEASRPEFRRYAQQIVANAAALADALAGHGFRLVSGGTDNHMLLVDLRSFDADLTGKQAQEVLDRAGITCNRNTIPDDPRSPFLTSGLRLGTAAETTAGMGPTEMQLVADLLVRTLKARDNEGEIAAVRSDVAALCAGFPPYPDLVG